MGYQPSEVEATLRLQFARLRRRMPGAISTAHPRRPDPRQLITDQVAFRAFVETVISGDLKTLPTQSQRDLAITIRREIAYSGLRPLSRVCRLMSELPKSEWRGINWKTLRDNYYRRPG